MSILSLTKINTANTTTDLTVTTANTTSGAMIVYANGNGLSLKSNTTTNAIFITATANVGIGNTNPQHKLRVEGTASFNGSITTVAGSTAAAPVYVTAGTNLTTAAAGALEYDGNGLYATLDTTNGRGIIPVTQYYYLSTNGAATSTTIAPFFGINSSIPLVANGIYEIEMNCNFLKNTAGTLVWTLTNSTTVTQMHIDAISTPLSGFSTTFSAIDLFAQQLGQTAASVAFVATGTITAATTQQYRFKISLLNGLSTSLRLNVTNSAGSVTPLTGSYWKATRISSVGTYAA